MKSFSMISVIIFVSVLIPLTFRTLVKDVKLNHEFKTKFIIDVRWLKNTCLVLFVISCILTIMLNLSIKLAIWKNILLIIANLIFILIIIACRFKIVVSENEILYTPCFGKTKIYNLNDITLIKTTLLNYGIINYKVYIGNTKIFSLSNMLKNVEEFISMARFNNINFEKCNK